MPLLPLIDFTSASQLQPTTRSDSPRVLGPAPDLLGATRSPQVSSLNTSTSSADGTRTASAALRRKTSEDLFIEELVGMSTFAAGLDSSSNAGGVGLGSGPRGGHSQDALAMSRQMYRDRLHALRPVSYTLWGATESTPWPVQNAKDVPLALIARQVFRGVTNLTVRRHETLILAVFAKSERLQRFMNDAFWYTFLEHFALLDSERRIHDYSRAVKADIRKEQESWVFRTIERAQRERERRERQQRRQQKALEESAIVGELRRLTDSEKRRKMRLKLKAQQKKLKDAARASTHKPTDPREAIMARFKTSRDERPLHVLSAREAMDFRVPVTTPAFGTRSERSGRSSRATSACSTSDFSDSARSGASTSSRAPSVASTALTMPEVLLPFDDEDLQHIMSAGRGRVHSRKYLGGVDPKAVIAMLLEAEELTAEELEAAKASLYGAEGMADTWTARAVSLIRREQDRMFSRMSAEYVTLFRSLTRVQKDAFIPSFPDMVARIVCQALTRLLPYAKDVLDDSVRMQIKRRFTYWVHGIENGEVASWYTSSIDDFVQMQSERDLGKSILTMSTAAAKLSQQPSKSMAAAGLLKSAVRSVMSPTKPVTEQPPPDKAETTPPMSAKRASLARSTSDANQLAATTPRPPATPRNLIPVTAATSSGSSPRSTIPTMNSSSLNATQPSPSGGAAVAPSWEAAKAPVRSYLRTVGDRGAVTVQMQELAYAQGLAEIRQAFETVRAGMSRRASVSGVGSDEADAGDADGHTSTAAFARLNRDVAQQQQRHVLFHRYAPINKRADLWHEQGRKPSQATLAHAPKSIFSLKAVSPLMRRFMEDQGATPVLDSGPAELVSWSL